jgi:hypothetical protein
MNAAFGFRFFPAFFLAMSGLLSIWLYSDASRLIFNTFRRSLRAKERALQLSFSMKYALWIVLSALLTSSTPTLAEGPSPGPANTHQPMTNEPKTAENQPQGGAVATQEPSKKNDIRNEHRSGPYGSNSTQYPGETPPQPDWGEQG